MNKKAQWQALLTVPVLLFALAVVALIAFLASPAIRFTILGGGVIVLTFIYVLPAMMAGSVTRQKIAIILICFAVGGVMIFAGNSGFMQSFSDADAIYVNTYGKLTCQLVDGNYPLIPGMDSSGWLTIPDGTSKTVSCGQDMNAYTNTCTFKLRNDQFWASLCTIKAEKCNNAGCVSLGVVGGNNEEVLFTTLLDSNRDNYIDSVDGDPYKTLKVTVGRFCTNGVKIAAFGNAYRLYDDSSNGYRTTYSQGCSLSGLRSSLSASQHLVANPPKTNMQGSDQVPFGGTLLYVDGATKVISSNIITQGSQRYYIQAPGFKIPIKTAVDGTKYANYQDQVADNNIECLPANVYTCNTDATFRDIPSQDVEGQDCSAIRGIPNNQFVQTSDTRCCLTSCVNNKIVYNSCEACVTNCPAGYAIDNTNNICVKVSDTSINTNISTCELKAKNQPWMGWSDVTKQPSTIKKIITLGFAKPVTTCEATFLPYYIWGIVGLGLVGAIYSLLKPQRRNVRKLK